MFNRANLERFSSGRFCAGCPAASRGGAGVAGGCPFEASYEALQARLFLPLDPRAPAGAPASPPASMPAAAAGATPRNPLVWVHGEALGFANPALRAHPAAPAMFVFDTELIEGRTVTTGGIAAAGPLAPGRMRFLRECLAELPVTVRNGDVAAELLTLAAKLGIDGIVTSRAVDPRFAAIAARVAAALPLQVLEPEPFVDLPIDGPGAPDLGRFSRYWRRAEPLVWGAKG
jgi:deoxyribodipyrimidine photo-lyase